MKIEYIGEVNVDSGQLMICDPCYLSHWKGNKLDKVATEKPYYEFSYKGCCEASFSKDKHGELTDGLAPLGIVFASDYGDGTYPVFVEKNKDGRVARVIINMDN